MFVVLNQHKVINKNIECIPTGFDVFPEIMPIQKYKLTVHINDSEPKNIVFMPNTSLQLGLLLIIMLREYELQPDSWTPFFYSGGGGYFAFEPIIISESYFSQKLTFKGLSYSDAAVRKEVNTIKITAANPTDDSVDLFKYLAKNGETELVMHSCAVRFAGGI